MLYDDARELDDDDTVTQTIKLNDSTMIVGVDPFRPIDARLVDGDDFKPIGITDRRLSQF